MNLSTNAGRSGSVPLARALGGGTVVDRASPVDLADALLDAALAARADVVWVDPLPLAEDRYLVTLERQGDVLVTSTLDAQLATAVIARFALLAEIDLVSRRIQTGTVELKSRFGAAGAIVTIRPGTGIRAEVLLVRRDAVPARSVPAGGYNVAIGERIGHYRVLAHLGSGGMGSVYRVDHIALGRTLALKVLHASVLSHEPDAAARFLREARAAARIKNAGIVEVFDFGHLPDGRPYIVMELLTGTSLTDVLVDGPLEPRRAVGVARQLAAALAAAHERGVVHADISPSNVLIEETEQGTVVKLVDFGLAQLRDDDLVRADSNKQAEYVFGTPSYISPEQIRGNGAEESSDIYSLGAVLYEMLTGYPPFAADDLHELCLKHLQAPPPEPSSPDGPLPRPLVELVVKALAKTAQQRQHSMRELLAELDEIDRAMFKRGWRRWLPA
jgi:eukaryotic-like serine/threonine-protein kinase